MASLLISLRGFMIEVLMCVVEVVIEDGLLCFEMQDVPDYTTNLLPVDGFDSKPLAGLKIGIISETVGDGVDGDVLLAVRQAVAHLESLGASIREVLPLAFPPSLLHLLEIVDSFC